jgi:hypothetical protein
LTELLFRSLPLRDPSATLRPVTLSAAYEVPPRAMKTADVVITFA